MDWREINVGHNKTTQFFTFSSHTEYVKRENIVNAKMGKKIKEMSPFDKCSCFVCLKNQNKKKICLSVCLAVCPSVRFSVRMSVCTSIRGHNNF